MKNIQLVGLALLSMLVLAHVNSHEHNHSHHQHNDDNYSISVKQVSPGDAINNAKGALDGYIAIREASKVADVASKLNGLKQLSASLGIVGSLVGFIFSFFGSGPDPEILKLQQMVRETQTLITLGNQEILNAIRKLNSQEAQRSAMESMNILDTLVQKHLVQGLEYDVGGYDVLPCGNQMTLCNNAFVDLSKRIEDILSASFDESPRGDKQRLQTVGDNLLLLLSNSFYSLSWLNARHYRATHPNDNIQPTDTAKITQVSQSTSLKHYFDTHAVAAYERWVQNNKFQTCRLCTSCGGDYPQYQGEGLREDDWGHWLRYREQCSAQLYSESGPPNLCCSKDLPPLMYCESCGGEYPYRVARRLNRDDWGPYIMRGNGCGGDFYKTNREFEICARNRRQCKMCGGNCGNGYAQVGKVERIDDWGIWSVYDENSCRPDYNGDLNTERSADVSLCCLDFTS